MNYEVFILPRADRELDDLPLDAQERIESTIERLAGNPRPHGCRKLVNRAGWRIRVGAYRVIYEIDDSMRRVTVMNVGHRRDVYE